MYFNDAPTVTRAILTGKASFAQYFFFGLFTATTYLLAGWAREQVCTYMCPWPRFQAALLDEDSYVVTYQKWRGEPRAPLKKSQDWSRPRRLHRLQPVRRGLPDGHRHPRRPAARVHRLRAVHRRLQRRDDPDRPAARADHAVDTERNQALRAAGEPSASTASSGRAP